MTQLISAPTNRASAAKYNHNIISTTPAKVPGVATLLGGPLLRGQQVTVK